jgi:hypothetical protein
VLPVLLVPILAAAHKSAALSPVAAAVWIVIGLLGALALILILRNYHRQRDFERSDHVVPEDYD